MSVGTPLSRRAESPHMFVWVFYIHVTDLYEFEIWFMNITIKIERQRLMFNAKWTILRPYYGENRFHLIRCTSIRPTRLIRFYNVSSLIQQSADRHVASNIIMISSNRCLLLLLNAYCLEDKQQIRSNAHKASTKTTTPPRRF